MSAGFTPGPWKSERKGHGFDIFAGADYLDRTFVAFTAVLPDGADSEPNAKAIAAVPAMVEAMREALPFFARLARYGEDSVWRPAKKHGEAIEAALKLAGIEE